VSQTPRITMSLNSKAVLGNLASSYKQWWWLSMLYTQFQNWRLNAIHKGKDPEP